MNPADLYEEMLLIRTLESKLLGLFTRGEIRGTIHTCMGQEACAVGVMKAIDRERDLVFSNHRGHGHAIAYGAPPEGLVAEILGKASGFCRGIGGSQHLHWKNFYTTGVQGGLMPVAVGAALAERHKKTGAVVVIFLGDGTMGQGIVYEAFNLASLWNLPVVFVLEHNRYAQTTPTHQEHAGNLETRAQSFGIPATAVDGNNIEAVYEAASEAVRQSRETGKPHFLVLHTYRLGPHSKGDDMRSKEEIAEHRQRDPLLLVGKNLDENVKNEIGKRITGYIDDVISRAVEEPCLAPEEFSGRSHGS